MSAAKGSNKHEIRMRKDFVSFGYPHPHRQIIPLYKQQRGARSCHERLSPQGPTAQSCFVTLRLLFRSSPFHRPESLRGQSASAAGAAPRGVQGTRIHGRSTTSNLPAALPVPAAADSNKCIRSSPDIPSPWISKSHLGCRPPRRAERDSSGRSNPMVVTMG